MGLLLCGHCIDAYSCVTAVSEEATLCKNCKTAIIQMGSGWKLLWVGLVFSASDWVQLANSGPYSEICVMQIRRAKTAAFVTFGETDIVWQKVCSPGQNALRKEKATESKLLGTQQSHVQQLLPILKNICSFWKVCIQFAFHRGITSTFQFPLVFDQSLYLQSLLFFSLFLSSGITYSPRDVTIYYLKLVWLYYIWQNTNPIKGRKVPLRKPLTKCLVFSRNGSLLSIQPLQIRATPRTSELHLKKESTVKKMPEGVNLTNLNEINILSDKLTV